jgi:hypothetical protein
MRFCTSAECEYWLQGAGRTKPDADGQPAKLRLSFPKDIAGPFRWANWIANNLIGAEPCLVWIAEWGIFPSCENLHLYYSLRQAAHDFRLLEEAPGHLFLKHEKSLLVSFLQVAMLNLWGGYILNRHGYVDVFFSHDEFFDFYLDDVALIENIRHELSPK